MILSEFTFSQEPSELKLKFEYVLNSIEKHCSEFLNEFKQEKKLLYHGFNSNYDTFLIGRSRDKRRPKDSPSWFNKIVDSYLYEAGFTALRGNSIFVTGSIWMASDYGTAYAMFPINGFTYTWCADYKDFYEDISDFEIKNSNVSPQEFVNHYDFRDGELSTAIDTGHEILIHGQYIAINNYWLSNNNDKNSDIYKIWNNWINQL